MKSLNWSEPLSALEDHWKQRMRRPFFKPYIEAIRAYEPGKPIEEVERELGLRRVIKLASNENPLGTSKKVVREIRRFASSVHLYPDGAAFALKKRLAEELGVKENEMVLGNGSNEIIEFLVKGFVKEGEKVISSETTFLVYALITQSLGGEYVEVPMKDFRYDLEAIAEAVDEKTRLIFIANPNNPTGTYVTRREVTDFLDRVPEHVVVCFDEAYRNFVQAEDFPDMLFFTKLEKPNLMVLRTFSKSHGLAGLRVGYGIAHEDLIGYLNKIRQPFNVNSMAQRAALAALEDRDYLEESRKIVLEGRESLYRAFKKLRLPFWPSQSNFVLFDSGHDGDQLFEALLRRGIIVRSMKSYGLSTFIRVSIGKPGENRKFVRELKSVLKSFRRNKAEG